MDRAKFFAALRAARLFGKTLPQKAVAGIEHLLDVQQRYLPEMGLDELSIALATAFHETAGTMQPIKERGARSYFNKYEPGTKIGKALGNTVKGDGYRFRGEGHVQNTGRRNAAKATERLNALFGLGVDLVKNPDMRGDPLVSALSLFVGCREGWWTGKAWDDYLDGVDESDEEDLREFMRSRAVVNGSDKARKIGEHALVIEAALRLAGFAPAPAGATPAAKVYTDRTTVEVVQLKLKALGYPVGDADGVIGKLTREQLLAFRLENKLPLSAMIDDALLAALDEAEPRELAGKREDAPPEVVRKKVPEVWTNWLSKVGAFFTGILAFVGAAFNGIVGNLGIATGYVQPVKDAVGDVPGWVWFAGIGIIAFGLFMVARHGEAKGIEAFQGGERR